MEIGASSLPRRQSVSHGWPQTRPQIEASGIGPAGVTVGLFITPFCNQGDVTSGLRVNRTGLHAREVRLQPFKIDEF